MAGQTSQEDETRRLARALRIDASGEAGRISATDAYRLADIVVEQQSSLTSLRAENERLADDEAKLRLWLWINHGCNPSILYGDDGEIQCGHQRHGPIDFKRDPLLQIHKRLKEAAEAEVERLTKERDDLCAAYEDAKRDLWATVSNLSRLRTEHQHPEQEKS